MVRTKKRAVSVHSLKEQAKGQSNSCALSQEPLRAPVVMCAMGQLFNKDALIEYMLAKHKYPHFSHITQLKDVANVTLQWTEATAAPASSSSSESKDNNASSISASDPSSEQRALYCCPITALPSNGTNKFVAMQPCGCVISERALRQVGAGAGAKIDTCIVCGKELAQDTLAAPTAVPAAAAAASEAAAASSSSAATAAAAASSPSSAAASSSATAASVSPFHHPSYVTLYPGPEETLYLRAVLAERIKQREADKLADKLAKKAAKKTAAAAAAATANGTVSATAGEPVDPAASAGSHKRKAEGESTAASSSSSSSSTAAVVAPPRKKAHVSGAHAALVASRTGNVISDKVKQITEQAAQAVADRRKDANFNSMFLTPEQIAAIRFDSISTKPSSLMSML